MREAGVKLALRGAALDLEPGRPLLMGIVNATPDSFSDAQGEKSLADLRERALRLADDGAAIIDVGGESGRTDRDAITEEQEIARVVPLVELLVAEGLPVSVDTWRAAVAHAAVAAGAALINDVSGLAEPEIARVCAESGVGLVITHTRASPKTKRFPAYDDVVADVLELLEARSAEARQQGLDPAHTLLDPGLDLSKTPAESVEVLRRLPELERLGRPILLAISRKDFVGAITGRPPGERDAGTLAAVEPALDFPHGAVLRVHDVRGAADFLAVRSALRGTADAPRDPLDAALRHEPEIA